MRFSDQSYNLRVELNTQGCELSAMEIQRFERALDPLRDLVRKFPISDLNVGIEFYPRSNTYGAKLALDLPGRRLRTSEQDQRMYTAYDRAVRAMVENVLAYEENLGGLEERTKQQQGTRHDVLPTAAPDAAAIEDAIAARDYGSFRRELYVYEEPLRLRIGRWVQRYPQLDARLGGTLRLPDILEEVFLNAFEQYESRPQQVPLGEWLASLVDPSLRELREAPDEELENIGFVRSQRGATADET
jgi:hypothetical protein